MSEPEDFRRRSDEAGDFFFRFWRAFPVRRNEGTLKQRWESGDRNVIRITGHDDGDRYELRFTEEQKQALLEAYIVARAGYADLGDDGFNARVFVDVLESWGDSIQEFSGRRPDNQKERVLALNSINVAFFKLDEALSKLDSGALGYWYAHIADATEEAMRDSSISESAFVSMVNQPTRAIVEGGEMRQALRTLISAWVKSTELAASTLPKHNHQQNDDRLQTARGLERMVIEHQIPFTTSETGFPALCLRAVFDLGGLEVEKVSYWLKKAADDPDSFARFLEGMRRKTDGKNLPSV